MKNINLKQLIPWIIVLLLVVYGIFVGEVNAHKEIEIVNLNKDKLKVDSLFKSKEKEFSEFDHKVDSLEKVNENLVDSVKGSLTTITHLLDHNKINDKDKEEALKWLDQ